MPTTRGKPDPEKITALFRSIRRGDVVAVDWRHTHPSPEYGVGGEVVFVSERLVAIQAPLGYVFSVSLAQALTGVKITVTDPKGGKGCMAGVKLESLDPETRKRVLDVVDKAGPANETLPAGEGAGAEALPRESGEIPSPLECVERGLPLDQARIMTPKDLLRETAEILLAAGVSKAEIVRLYGFRSKQGGFAALAKYGLHKSARSRVAPEDRPMAVPNRKGVHLTAALSRRDRLRANLRSIEDIFTYAAKGPLRLTEDIGRDLAALQTKYAAELARIETALQAVWAEVFI